MHASHPTYARSRRIAGKRSRIRISTQFSAVIELSNVTQHYGIRPVLRDISLKIRAGRLAAVVGPNGMGKTTLLGVMAGALTPQKGYCEINGLRRRRSEAEELEIRPRVVYLSDHPWLPVEGTGANCCSVSGGFTISTAKC